MSSLPKTPKQMTVDEIDATEAKMRPIQSSALGFLTQNESLLAVCATDDATLARLGVSCEQIGKCIRNYVIRASQMEHDFPLTEVLAKGAHRTKYGLSTDGSCFKMGTKINDEIVIASTGWHGSQHCPFIVLDDQMDAKAGNKETKEEKDEVHPMFSKGECKHSSSVEYLVYNIRLHEYITFSGLHEHLIQDHQFFEGHTQFRVEPMDLVRILNVSNTRDYELKYVMNSKWFACSWSQGCNWNKDVVQSLRLVNDEYQIFLHVDEKSKNSKTFTIKKPVTSRAFTLHMVTITIEGIDFNVDVNYDQVGFYRSDYREYILT